MSTTPPCERKEPAKFSEIRRMTGKGFVVRVNNDPREFVVKAVREASISLATRLGETAHIVESSTTDRAEFRLHSTANGQRANHVHVREMEIVDRGDAQ